MGKVGIVRSSTPNGVSAPLRKGGPARPRPRLPSLPFIQSPCSLRPPLPSLSNQRAEREVRTDQSRSTYSRAIRRGETNQKQRREEAEAERPQAEAGSAAAAAAAMEAAMTGGAEVVELNVGGRRRVRARTPPHNPPMGSYGAADPASPAGSAPPGRPSPGCRIPSSPGGPRGGLGVYGGGSGGGLVVLYGVGGGFHGVV